MSSINGNTMTVEEYTPEEKEKIKELRERFSKFPHPEYYEDNCLIKWLRARNLDVDIAEDMLKKHIRFSKLHGLYDYEKLSDYKLPEPLLYFYTAFLGYDKDGSIVRLINAGDCDLRGLSMCISHTECIKYATYILLSDIDNQRRDRANDKICDQSVYIINLQNLSWKTIIQRTVVRQAFALMKAYEANFPERLKVVYIVNAPSFFSFIYSWLKTVLPESIISKLEILTPEECQSRLLESMDPKILPATFGGSRIDPDGDENCQSLFSKPLGTPVPESFYSSDQLEVLKNDPEAKKVSIDYKAIFIAEKLVTVPNSTLTWDFQTTDYDIRMGIRYKQDENSEAESIIPVHRVDSHIIPESGSFMCENPGIYEIVFDNSYSWMTSKELFFKIGLILPKEDVN